MNPNEEPIQNEPIVENSFSYTTNSQQPVQNYPEQIPQETYLPNPLQIKINGLVKARNKTAHTFLFSLVGLIVGFGSCFTPIGLIGLFIMGISLLLFVGSIVQSISIESDIKRLKKLIAQKTDIDKQDTTHKVLKALSLVVLFIIMFLIIGGGLCFGILASIGV